MAIKPADEYVYSNAANADYPYGSGKNETSNGAGNGTPLDEAWVNDIFGFHQAILVAGGVVPSGAPDTARASQYLQALRNILTPTGRVEFCLYSTPDPGWVELYGSIGNAASNAVTRAHEDTWPLYSKLWSNAGIQMYTSAGVLTAKGATAALDFVANKRLKLPDSRGRYPRGWDHGAGVDPAAPGIGALQEDAIQNIIGTFTVDDRTDAQVPTGAFVLGDAVTGGGSTGGGDGYTVSFDASRVARTATETRVKGFIGMWVIKL